MVEEFLHVEEFGAFQMGVALRLTRADARDVDGHVDARQGVVRVVQHDGAGYFVEVPLDVETIRWRTLNWACVCALSIWYVLILAKS